MDPGIIANRAQSANPLVLRHVQVVQDQQASLAVEQLDVHEQELLHDLAAKSWAPATRRAYASAWRSFDAWCRSRSRQALPASVETVSLYLAAQAKRATTCPLSVSTLNRRLAAIGHRHALAGYDHSPTSSAQVHQLARAVRRSLTRVQRQAAAMTLVELHQVVDHVDRSTLAGKRDAALLLVGFFAALRRSELVAVEIEHLKDAPGGLSLTIPRSKTDQEGEGQIVGLAARPDIGALCPVTAVREWCSAAALEAGPIFRGLTRTGRLRRRSLHPDTANQIVKKYCRLAGLDATQFSGHSLRAGLVTQAFRDGLRDEEIMGTTRHESAAMLARYRRVADPVKRGVSGTIGRVNELR